MKLKEKRKDVFEYKQYEIRKQSENKFILEAWENLDWISLGEFKDLESLKKFIRKRDKEFRNKNKCVHCGYLKIKHKASTMQCPYDNSEFTWFLKTTFKSKLEDSN